MALPASLATKTVTRIRAATTMDAHGNTILNWGAASSTAIVGCGVQPLDGSENVLGRDAVTTLLKLYAPPEADLLSSDRIQYGGATYEIDGNVQVLDALPALAHKKCFLKLVEG
jgi:hypothetical protein